MVTWLIANEGWSDDDRSHFQSVADEVGVRLSFFINKTELAYYINNKFSGESRADDRITKFVVFSHGFNDGTLSLGYNYNDNNYNRELNIKISDICNFSGHAFLNPNSWFYSCNTGTNISSYGYSFAARWHQQVGGRTGAYIGKTSYDNIMYPKGYNALLNLNLRREIKSLRKDFGFSKTGSKNYPSEGNGTTLVVHSW